MKIVVVGGTGFIGTKTGTRLQEPRQILANAQTRHFDAALNDRSLAPGEMSRIGATHFEEWLNRTLRRPETGRWSGTRHRFEAL